MKRRTLLILLIPTLAITSGAVAVGLLNARLVPTDERVEESTTLDEAWGLRVRTEHLDDWMSLTLVVGTLGVAFAAAVLIVHVSQFARMRAWRERVFAGGEPAPPERPYVAAAIAVGLVLSGLLISYSGSNNLSPEGAEVGYLETALRAAQWHGTARFPLALYSGAWSEDDQHPLYPWLLTPMAIWSFDFFVVARLLSMLLSAAALVTVVVVAARSFGKAAAGLTALIFGANWLFVRTAPEVSAEPLLLIFFAASFYFAVRGFDRPRLLLAAGALAGLAWMTRVTGLLLPAAFVPAALATWGCRALRNRWFYLYFAAFVVAASPLVVRNLVRYHNPLHEHAFRMFWIDKPEQRDTEDFARGKLDAPFYLRGAGPLKLSLRVTEGLENVLTTAAQSVSPTSRVLYAPPGSSKSYEVQWYAGMVVLLAACAAVLLDVRRGRRAYVIALGGVAALFVGWYSRVTTIYDFMLPLAPLMLMYFAAVVVGLFGSWRYRALLLVAVCAVAFYGAARRTGVLRPRLVEFPSNAVRTLGDWISANVAPNEIYYMYDDTLKAWFMEGRGKRQDVPNTETVESLIRTVRRRGGRYVIVSKWLLGRRTLQFGTTFTVRGNSIVPDRVVEGWQEVYRDAAYPVDYIIYEVLPAAQEGAGGAGGNPNAP